MCTSSQRWEGRLCGRRTQKAAGGLKPGWHDDALLQQVAHVERPAGHAGLQLLDRLYGTALPSVLARAGGLSSTSTSRALSWLQALSLMGYRHERASALACG